MTERHYPELERRREMLRRIHGWTEARVNANAPLGYTEFIELMRGGPDDPENHEDEEVSRKDAGRANTFLQLIDEGYINGRYEGADKGTNAPFSYAWIRGLSAEKGLPAIEELPDPHAELLARLDSISEAIRALDDEEAPPEQRRLAERALDEVKHFLRGLPPGVATELGSRALGG